MVHQLFFKNPNTPHNHF